MPLRLKAPASSPAILPEPGTPAPLADENTVRNQGSALRVSVVIPLYNHEKYIEAALRSVWSQTAPPAEIIVIDDGSVDGSAQKVRQLCQDHPEVIFWSWPNQGAHHTLNAGILRATGDFVSVLNSDDCYEPQRLAACLAVVQSDASVDVVATGVSFVDDQGASISNPWYDDALAFYQKEGDVALGLFHANFLVTTSNLFIRRSVFESIGSFAPLRYTHDLEFFLRLILGQKTIHFLDQPLLAYRLHQKNTMAEDKVRGDIERAAVFAFFLYRKWRGAGAKGAWRSSLARYIEVLGQQAILESVEKFLTLLEKDGQPKDEALAGSLPTEFLGFLSRLGVDWVGHGGADPLLARFVAARKIFLRRHTEARRVAKLKADGQWLLEQRDAWQKAAQIQAVQVQSLTQALAEQEKSLTQALAEQEKSLTQALAEQEKSLTQALAEQEKSAAQALDQLRADKTWLFEQRNAWEQAARAQEEQSQSLTRALEDTRVSNAELQAQCMAFEQLASERAQSIANLTASLQQFSATVAALQTQRVEQAERIAALLAERERIFNSLSWKITRPLRYVRRELMSPLYALTRTSYQRWHQRLAPGKAAAATATEMKELGSRHQVLLVLHEFSLTGAPRAVLYLARAFFVLYGVRPVAMAPIDGPIREEFEQDGFPTIVDPMLFEHGINSPETSDLIAGFAKVIVTPLAAFPFVRRFKGDAKRLTWWIHEEDKGFAYIAENFAPDLTSLFDACDAVWLGSPLCFAPASRYGAPEKLHLLLYGCDDISLPARPHPSGRMVFTIVGSVEPRKGQDLFLDAIERLPVELRRKAIFRIIGSPYNDWSAHFHAKICAQASLIPEVECIPNMSFQRLRELYSETDVVVSASRADPMPISITQGLMFAKVCLCSGVIGHAKLLVDEKDGLIFNDESSAELAEKMTWLIQNPDKLPALGAAGRLVYEKHFLMTSFIDHVSALVQDQVQIEQDKK